MENLSNADDAQKWVHFLPRKKSRKKVVKSEKKTVETFQVDGPLSKTMRESLKAKFSPMQYLKS